MKNKNSLSLNIFFFREIKYFVTPLDIKNICEKSIRVTHWNLEVLNKEAVKHIGLKYGCTLDLEVLHKAHSEVEVLNKDAA